MNTKILYLKCIIVPLVVTVKRRCADALGRWPGSFRLDFSTRRTVRDNLKLNRSQFFQLIVSMKPRRLSEQRVALPLQQTQTSTSQTLTSICCCVTTHVCCLLIKLSFQYYGWICACIVVKIDVETSSLFTRFQL